MTAIEVIKDFLTVHKCGGCDEILDKEHKNDAFCPECALEWSASLTQSCPQCYKAALECTCMPKVLSSSGALCLRKLFFYDNEHAKTAQMSLIFWLKYRKSRRMTLFAANQLLPLVKNELSEILDDGSFNKVIVSSVPRGKRSVIDYGFDHAQLVAKEIASSLDVEYVDLFGSRYNGKKQKELNKKQRLQNAKKNIFMRKNVDVEGKFVVLFDDIVTTGASMSVCANFLIKSGCRGVICTSLASKK